MSIHSLPITLDQKDVATIIFDSQEESYRLNYSHEWQKNGFAISPHLPLNENFDSIEVKRFDRLYTDDQVERLHVIDGCQMLNFPSTYKYERNFGSSRDVKEIRHGASFSKLFEATALCEVPAKAKLVSTTNLSQKL